MAEQAGFTIKTFPSSRQFTMDVGRIGAEKHHIRAMIEVDVTDARNRIRKSRAKSGKTVSFTAWALKCIGTAIAEHREVNALRRGRNRLMIFDDVDISLLVEREVRGVPVPLPMVIRSADRKGMAEIFYEIEQAKKQDIRNEKDYVLESSSSRWPARLFAALPQPIRLALWRIVLSDPVRVKRMMGTAVVTSVGMMGRARGWFIPFSMHPVCFALGSIVKKPAVVNDAIRAREFLQMTVLIDHDVVDGAPAARFVSRLVELMETGFNL